MFFMRKGRDMAENDYMIKDLDEEELLELAELFKMFAYRRYAKTSP